MPAPAIIPFLQNGKQAQRNQASPAPQNYACRVRGRTKMRPSCLFPVGQDVLEELVLPSEFRGTQRPRTQTPRGQDWRIPGASCS